MIVAAGLTPAWQQILAFDAFRPGEVNRAASADWCGSGKVLNVGLALATLGADCVTVAPLAGPARALIEEQFHAAGARAAWVDCASATRVCTTILDRSTGGTTELVQNAAALSALELSAFHAAFQREAQGASVVVLSGSLPGGVPPSFYANCLSATGAQVILDACGPELLAALPGATS